jgi:hypothetical protein
VTRDDIKPGMKLLWKHTRKGITTYKAARVLALTPRRVRVLVSLYGRSTWRIVKAERLVKQ